MSERAAAYIAGIGGMGAPSPELVNSCNPIELYSHFGMPLEIHRARAADRLGVMGRVATYAMTHVEIVYEPLNSNIPNNEYGLWTPSLLKRTIEDKVNEKTITETFLGKNAKTGLIRSLGVEAISAQEMPVRALRVIEKLDATHSSRTYYPDNTLFYRLIGAAKMGSLEPILVCGMSLVPYFGTDKKRELGPRLAVHAFNYQNGVFDGDAAIKALRHIEKQRQAYRLSRPLQAGSVNGER